MKASRTVRLAFFVAAALVAPLCRVTPVQAQVEVARLNQMQSDLNYLGRLIAELQEAVRAERGARQGLSNLEQRLGALENEIRSLTAATEQVQFAQQQAEQRATQAQTQLTFRLDQLEAQLAAQSGRPAVEAPGGGLSSNALDSGFQLVQPQPQLQPPSPAAPTGGALSGGFDPYQAAGLIEEPELAGRKDAAAEAYRAAYQLVQRADYPAAEAALRGFVSRYPDDALQANASYWLGETFYRRDDFQQAAIQFAAGYRQYGNSDKSGEMLLHLGLSLAALGRRDEACGSLALLTSRFALPRPDLAEQGRSQARALGCS